MAIKNRSLVVAEPSLIIWSYLSPLCVQGAVLLELEASSPYRPTKRLQGRERLVKLRLRRVCW